VLKLQLIDLINYALSVNNLSFSLFFLFIEAFSNFTFRVRQWLCSI